MSRSLSIASLLVAALAADAPAAVANLSPVADAPIKQLMIDTNFRDAPLSTRLAASNDERTMMLFDLAAIPPASVINSATLFLNGHAILGSTAETSVSLFRVTRSWLEDQVTYRQAKNFDDWTNLGGDYVGATGVYDVNPYSTWIGPQGGLTDAWYAFDATSLVQEWYAGVSPNEGLLLRGAPGNELEYASSEAASESQRPYLEVNYQPVPEPAAAWLAAITAAVGVVRRLRVS